MRFTQQMKFGLNIFTLIVITALALVTGCTQKSTQEYTSVLDLVESKSASLANDALKNDQTRFTDYTSETGQWQRKSAKSWCSGFVPGIFWYLNALTEDESWKEHALLWTEGLRHRATKTDNDTGFQIFDSFGLGYTIGGEHSEDFKSVLVTGATTLVEQRYNPQIGAFRSWKQRVQDPATLPFEVNIDQLMNMELVLWVGENANKPEYTTMAISHADKTWENNVRENGSTYHVVSYDLAGDVVEKRTHQGWKKDSTWSRGQAWAVYAYAMYYRYTGLDRMLERSKISYQYFLEATQHQTDDWVPYSDFDAPIDAKNPRDTSATAVVASALLELYQITNDEKFLQDAQAMLVSLSSPPFLAMDPNYQAILLKGSEKWGEPEVGSIFGDYFFVEALYRWKLWSPKKLPANFGL